MAKKAVGEGQAVGRPAAGAGSLTLAPCLTLCLASLHLSPWCVLSGHLPPPHACPPVPCPFPLALSTISPAMVPAPLQAASVLGPSLLPGSAPISLPPWLCMEPESSGTQHRARGWRGYPPRSCTTPWLCTGPCHAAWHRAEPASGEGISAEQGAMQDP